MSGGGLVPVDTEIDHALTAPRVNPSQVFARSFSGRPVPLGTDVTLELRGGDRLGPTGIMWDLDLDWEPELMRSVSDACAGQRIRGSDWFTMPAVLLGGQTGAGRTHVARRLARAAGVPHITFDASTDMFVGHHARPDVALPLPIISAMVASGCANPVVSVVGIDKASNDMIEVVSRLVDASSNAAVPEPAIATVIDYSAVTWIVQSRDTGAVPDGLVYRLRRIDLRGASWQQIDLRAIDLLAEVLADRAIALPEEFDLEELFRKARSWRRCSTLELYRHVDALVAVHAPIF